MQNQDNNLKTFANDVKDHAVNIWNKKFWIIAISLIFAALLFFREYTKEVKYTAKLSFMLNDDDQTGGAGLGAILGQFGLGGGTSGSYSLEKIEALNFTQNILNKTLFTSENIDGEQDALINHIIRNVGFAKGFMPYTSDSIYDPQQKIEYKKIIKKLSDPLNKALNISYNDRNGIIKLTSTTSHEALSAALVEKHFDNLSNFYINKSVVRQQATYNLMQSKVDSIQGVLYGKEGGLAVNRDKLGLVLNRDNTSRLRLERDVQMLSTMYGEALKNLETSRFLLQTSTPFFQLIDRPLLPLDKTRKSIVTQAIVGLLLGSFLALFFFIARKLYRDKVKVLIQ